MTTTYPKPTNTKESKDLPVIKLTPPIFQNVNLHQNTGDILHKSGNVKRTYVCLRPSRQGLPRLHAEMLDNKIVVHNYGHGGSGWTLVFGSVDKSLQEFAKLASGSLLPLDTKITIIGAGCIGLTTAVYLHEKGYRNIHIVADKLEDTTSHKAGGLFGVAALKIDDEVVKREVEYQCLETWRRYMDIATGKDPLFKKGVSKVYAYTGHEDNVVGPLLDYMGLDTLLKYGVIPPGEEVMVDFGARKFKMRRFESFYFYTITLMAELQRLCKERGIHITLKKVESFSEIDSPVIFNCAGLGARELGQDELMHPTCGHMVELQNQPKIEDTNYIVSVIWADKPVKKPEEIANLPIFYYMPKGEGVAGGTFMKHYNGEDKVENEKQWKGIVDRARGIFGTFTPKPAL